MIHDLIGKEFQQYVYADERVTQLMDRERASLQQYAEGNDPNPRYIAKMNSVYQTIANYMASVESLLDSIFTAREIVGGQYRQQTGDYRLREVEEENQKLKLYIRSMGKDPDLVRYMKVRDFQY